MAFGWGKVGHCGISLYIARIWKTEKSVYSVGFDILAAIVMKSFIFWDVMSCNLLKID